jgi:hypothetical protein
LIAGRFGLDTAFLASALIVLGSAAIALRLLYSARFEGDSNASCHRKTLARQV